VKEVFTAHPDSPYPNSIPPDLSQLWSGIYLSSLQKAQELGLPEGDTSTLEGGA
jgi:hypothetical protein